MKTFTIKKFPFYSLSLLLCLFLNASSFAQAPDFEWAVKGNSKTPGSFDEGRSIAKDAAGNSYVTGAFTGTATFGSTTLTSSGIIDVFVVKYDASGTVQWAVKGGGIYHDIGYGIAVDASGNSYVTGYFSGTATFGSITLTGIERERNVFVVKYDALGTVQWAVKGGGTLNDIGYGIAVDASGNSYVTGHFEGTATFGSYSLTNNGSYGWDVFVVKYDASGTVEWALKGGGAEFDAGHAITIDSSGNSYVTGPFQGTATFGGITLTSSWGWDVFVVKYNTSGIVQWATKGGGTYNDVGRGIAVDGSGNSYVTGYFRGTATFGSSSLTSSGGGGDDVFVVKYDVSGNLLWAVNGGGTSEYYGHGIAVDSSGNSYVTGYFLGTATFGSTSLTSSGSSDVFIVKYDASGTVQWAVKGGGSSNDTGFGITTDGSGNSYVTGYIADTATFGSTTLTSSGSTDVFVVKYNPSGIVQWSKNIETYGNSYSIARHIATDPSGNSYVTGSFQGTALFGSTTLTSSGGTDVFVVKYDSSGTVQWAVKGGGLSSDHGNGIAVDNSGNSYVTGYFAGTVTFDSTTLTSNGSSDVFVVKYNAFGTMKWAVKGGGGGVGGVTINDYGYGIAVDSSRNSYVTGSFQGTATFGSTTLTSSGNSDVFVVKYDTSGNVQWAVKEGGSSSDVGGGIAVDGSGNSYVTGYFAGTATFGTTTLTSSGNSDVFVVKYDASGNVLWAVKGGGGTGTIGHGIAVDSSGNSYVTGYFLGTASFGSTSLTNSGSSDVFVVKYDASGTVQWAVKGGGSSNDIGFGIAVDGSGQSYVTGYFVDTASFGSTNLTSNGGADVFVVKYNPSGIVQWAVKGGGLSNDIGSGIAADGSGKSYVSGNFIDAATFGTKTLQAFGTEMFVAKLNGNNISISTSSLNVATLCPGASINVDFTASGTFNSGNTFTAELSDANGDFTSPTAIGTLASIISGTINATIPANIPAGTGYRIRVVSDDPVVTGGDNGINITIGNFANTWLQKTNTGGTARFGAVAFSIGNKIYVGTGKNGSTFLKDFWEYDISANTWTRVADFPGTARYRAVGFSIGNKGYIGTGTDATGNNNDFWEYDPINNSWSAKTGLPAGARYDAVGFSIGNKGYIGTGWDGGYLSDFWEYDPLTNSWNQKASFAGGGRVEAVGFSVGNKGYIGTGLDGNYKSDFWEYDPLSNIWIQKASFGGGIRVEAVGFGAAGRGYLGLGYNGNNVSDFWEYNPVTNQWKQKQPYTGVGSEDVIAAGVNNTGFIGTGINNGVEKIDFWQYTPADIEINAISPQPYCSGQNITIDYIATGDFGSCGINTFTAELSDATGNFTSPVVIGSLASNTSGSINATIPANTPAGTGYRIRVVSDDPIVAGGDNGGDLTINPNANAGTISGATQMCNHSPNYTFISSGDRGGVWSSSNTSVATIDPATGTVSAVSPGNTVITYTVNFGCNSPVSTSHNFQVNPSASITTQPVSTDVCDGGSAAFAVVVTPASNVFSYQWRIATTPLTDGGNISGSNTATLTINPATSADAASNYNVEISALCLIPGNQFSNDATLSILPDANAGTITGTASLCAGQTYIFTSDGDAGGTWSSSDNTIATVDPGTGAVTAQDAGVVDIVYNVISGCNSPVTATFTLLVDREAIFTSCPTNDITQDTDPGECTAVVNYYVTANGFPAPVITYAFAGATTGSGSGTGSGSQFNVGTTTVTVTATNNCGTSTCVFDVIVEDNEAPFPNAALLPDVIEECSATVSTVPTATDNCTGLINGVTTDPLTYNVQGTYTITWTFDDGNGNVSTQDQMVIIDDNTSPVPDVAVLPDIIEECSASVTTVPTATDNCAGTIIGTTTDPLIYNVQGTYTITWLFDDGNGNVSTQDQTVIIDDNTSPVPDVAVLPDIIEECSATVTTVPTATDNCTGLINGVTTDPLIYNVQGTYTITWTFDDGNGNQTTQTQNVIIDDVTPPPIFNLPVASAQCHILAYPPEKLDNCAGILTSVSPVGPQSINTQGTHVIYWHYDDGNGNTSIQPQTFVIDDVTAPVPDVAILPDVIEECSATIIPVPTATDNCTGLINGVTTDPLIYNVHGTYTITWLFDDGNGNVSTQDQTVIIDDNTAPSINCPANISVCYGDPVILNNPTGSDNCGGTVTFSANEPVAYNLGDNYVVWTATDENNNISTCTQVVTIHTMNIQLISTDVLCNGGNTGTITVNALAFPFTVANFSYSLDGGITTQISNIFTDLVAGTYTITVINQINNIVYCTANSTITVYEPPPLVVNVISSTPACFGGSTGTATAVASGGSGFYTYEWLNSNNIKVAFGSTGTNLGGGTYTVLVTDGNNCTATANVTIAQSTQITVDLGPDKIVFYGSLGYTGCYSLNATVTGGTSPFTYSWSSNNPNLPLASGNPLNICVTSDTTYTYTVLVIDANGCTATASVNIIYANIDCSNDQNSTKVTICRIPPGNPTSCQTVCVSVSAAQALLNNGSYVGACLPNCAQPSTSKITSTSSQLVKAELKIYPNPVAMTVNIEYKSENNDAQLLLITDLQGRIIREFNLGGIYTYQNQIDISDFENGIYFINFMGANYLIKSAKLIKIE